MGNALLLLLAKPADYELRIGLAPPRHMSPPAYGQATVKLARARERAREIANRHGCMRVRNL